MARLTDIELTEYLKSLDLNNPKNIGLYNTFSELLLISKDIFLELVELLLGKTVTIQDVQTLPNRSEETVRAFVETVKNNGISIASLRDEAKFMLTNSSNYHLLHKRYVQAENEENSSDFQHYITFRNQLYGTISAFATIDEFKTDKNSFDSYESMERKFLSILSADTVVQELKATILSSPWYRRLPKVSQLVMNCGEKAELLVNTDKLSAVFSSKAILISLLQGMVKFGNYSYWEDYLQTVVTAAAKLSSQDGRPVMDTLWEVVNTVEYHPIADLDKKDAHLFFDKFLTYQLLFFYFPGMSVFDSYRDEDKLTSIERDIVEVRYYLLTCQNFLKRIVDVCSISLKP